jgi:hypothetical protein
MADVANKYPENMRANIMSTTSALIAICAVRPRLTILSAMKTAAIRLFTSNRSRPKRKRAAKKPRKAALVEAIGDNGA